MDSALTKSVFTHVKTGGQYIYVATGKIESTGEIAVIYQSVETGQIWIRPASEFHDGRFVKSTTPTTQPD